MFRIVCSDVVPGCNARFEHYDVEAMVTEAARHAAQAHGLDDARPLLLRAVARKVARAA